MGTAVKEVSARMVYVIRSWILFDTSRFYPNMNDSKTPEFLSGRENSTTDEVTIDRRICKVGYICEVAFSKVAKTRGLQDVISNDYFPLPDPMKH